MKPKILIIGAGFAGIFAAKKLDELFKDTAEITLVSKNPHFEYHASLYKMLGNESPIQCCIPLATIFKNTHVSIVQDTIVEFNREHKIAYGKEKDTYLFDYAILTLGSENAYFNIQGISNYAHSFRSINDAVKLTRHIHDILTEKKENNDNSITEIVVVGGGPNGVEIAGELAVHTMDLALFHNLSPQRIHITLLEAQEHILGMLLPAEASTVQEQLHKLGVQVLTNSKIEEALPTGIIINGETMTTQTVIWTAGIKGHHLYSEWGFPTNKAGKVIVNEYLEAEPNMYVAGDSANVAGSGTAWPAVDQGELVAQNIFNKQNNIPQQNYINKQYPILIPVGQGWAIAKFKPITISGIAGWAIRQLFTFKFLVKLLTFSQAFQVMRSSHELCVVCKICNKENE